MKKLIKDLNFLWNKFKRTNESFWNELEEQLILNDVSAVVAGRIIEDIKAYTLRENINDIERITDLLKTKIINILTDTADGFKNKKSLKENNNFIPQIWIIVGVNGVGKTSTIAKLANIFIKNKKKVLLTAADTYRAAASEQLSYYSEKMNIPIVRAKRFSDPGAVVYDSVEKAVSKKIDIVLIDTAGRMHTAYNLMEELKKIKKIVTKKINREPDEILMVLDSTTGQNAKAQVSIFHEALNLSGLILTKTDGTSRGGAIISIVNEFKIPVKYITFGEKLEDIELFNPEKFTNILFS